MSITTVAAGQRIISKRAARALFNTELLDAVAAKLASEPEELREARRLRYEAGRYRNKLRRQRYTRHHIHNGKKPRR